MERTRTQLLSDPVIFGIIQGVMKEIGPRASVTNSAVGEVIEFLARALDAELLTPRSSEAVRVVLHLWAGLTAAKQGLLTQVANPESLGWTTT
jgi:hypothetical protein